MSSITHDADGNPFERIEEYKAVLQELDQINLRRQNNNAVFVSLNTVVLTAIGALLLSTRSLSWWVLAIVGVVSLAVVPINLMWRAALVATKRQSDFGYDYIREIEEEFRTRYTRAKETHLVGFFLRVKEAGLRGRGSSPHEIRLATYFVVLYPLLSVILGIVLYLIHKGLM